jgi:cysteine synthase A
MSNSSSLPSTATVATIALGVSCALIGFHLLNNKAAAPATAPAVNRSDSNSGGITTTLDHVGSTPLLHLKSFESCGVRILAKAEYMNPGGSIKDRAALKMIQLARESGSLNTSPPGLICEGTGGNTGIGLSLISRSFGHPVFISCPNNISQEKINLMRALGAEVHICPLVKSDHPEHYTQVAKARALKENQDGGPGSALHTDQFSNVANFQAHFESTAKEIYEQSGGKIDAFGVSAGTGGTIAGCASYFKSVDPRISTWLVDCQGSGMKRFLTEGVWGKRDSDAIFHSTNDTIAEGIGIGRLTTTLRKGLESIDSILSVTDREACAMCFWLLMKEGVFVGPSAALNVVGALKIGLKLRDERPDLDPVVVATVLCDRGENYVSKVYDSKWRKNHGFEGVDILPESAIGILEGNTLSGGPVNRGPMELFEGLQGGS